MRILLFITILYNSLWAKLQIWNQWGQFGPDPIVEFAGVLPNTTTTEKLILKNPGPDTVVFESFPALQDTSGVYGLNIGFFPLQILPGDSFVVPIQTNLPAMGVYQGDLVFAYRGGWTWVRLKSGFVLRKVLRNEGNVRNAEPDPDDVWQFFFDGLLPSNWLTDPKLVLEDLRDMLGQSWTGTCDSLYWVEQTLFCRSANRNWDQISSVRFYGETVPVEGLFGLKPAQLSASIQWGPIKKQYGLRFGDSLPGRSDSMWLDLKNEGDLPLDLGKKVWTGDTSDFRVIDTGTTTVLGAGENRRFWLKSSPQIMGKRLAYWGWKGGEDSVFYALESGPKLKQVSWVADTPTEDCDFRILWNIQWSDMQPHWKLLTPDSLLTSVRWNGQLQGVDSAWWVGNQLWMRPQLCMEEGLGKWILGIDSLAQEIHAPQVKKPWSLTWIGSPGELSSGLRLNWEQGQVYSMALRNQSGQWLAPNLQAVFPSADWQIHFENKVIEPDGWALVLLKVGKRAGLVQLKLEDLSWQLNFVEKTQLSESKCVFANNQWLCPGMNQFWDIVGRQKQP